MYAVWVHFFHNLLLLLFPRVRARPLSPVAGTVIYFVVYFASFLVYRRISLYIFFYFVVHLSFSPRSRIISYDCFVYRVWITRVYIFGRYFLLLLLLRCGGCSLSPYILFSFFFLSVYFIFMIACICVRNIKWRLKNKNEQENTYARRIHREDGFCQGRNIWIRPENKNAKIPFRYKFLTNALGAPQPTDDEYFAHHRHEWKFRFFSAERSLFGNLCLSFLCNFIYPNQMTSMRWCMVCHDH